LTDPYRRFYVRLHKHTGAVIIWRQSSFTCTGTLDQCEKTYRDAQKHNLLVGWWSLLSLLVLNWVTLLVNYSAIRQLRVLANRALTPSTPTAPVAPAGSIGPLGPPGLVFPPHPTGPPPGWYRNPAGPGQRYWDGITWTHWTHPR
jgi:hypothetical protein